MITRSTVRVVPRWRYAADQSGLFTSQKYYLTRCAELHLGRRTVSWHRTCSPGGTVDYVITNTNATQRAEQKELSPPNDCLCINRRKLSAQNMFDTNFLRWLWWQSWVRWLMTESLGRWIEMWNVRHIRTHYSRSTAGTSTDVKINIKYANAMRWQKLWKTASLQSWGNF